MVTDVCKEGSTDSTPGTLQAECASQFQCPDFGCVEHMIMSDGEGDVILLDFITFP